MSLNLKFSDAKYFGTLNPLTNSSAIVEYLLAMSGIHVAEERISSTI